MFNYTETVRTASSLYNTNYFIYLGGEGLDIFVIVIYKGDPRSTLKMIYKRYI